MRKGAPVPTTLLPRAEPNGIRCSGRGHQRVSPRQNQKDPFTEIIYMANHTNRSPSHRYLTSFVDWIRPTDSTESKIRNQAEDIRKRIKSKAADDGLTVRSTPWSGSYAKKTGLRRHMYGHHEIEGQDVDLAFIVSPHTKQGEPIESLLDRFERYAQATYPNTSRNPTKSSIRLDFEGTKLSYDIVPLRATSEDPEAQVLIRRDGQERLTSIQKHIEFVRDRTRQSDERPGRVKFNEGVRLVKWMREVRQSESDVLSEVPTIVIDLLCAQAFDELGVCETYTETLQRWFGKIAHVVRHLKRVDFFDYVDPRGSTVRAPWLVLDPTNAENNVIPATWGNLERQELATWFELARDATNRAISAEMRGRDSEVVAELSEVFGKAFVNHKDAP